MKKLLSLLLVLALSATCLCGVVFAADPIAEVTNDGKTQKVYEVNGMKELVQENGKTQIKLLANLTTEKAVEFPFTVSLDLNGHKMQSTSGNCMAILKAGTENQHTVVKNGTLVGTVMAVRVNFGSLELRDATCVAPKSVAAGIYEPDPKYNDKNIIDNCTLIAGGSACFSWHADPAGANPPNQEQIGLNILIQNTTMVQFTAGSNAIHTRTPAGGSFVTLGDNVTLYVNEGTEKFIHAGVTMEGKELKKVEGSFEYKYEDTPYSGLAKYETGAPAPVEPEKPAEPATPAVPETPAAPAVPETPATPSVPSTTVPDVEVPKTGASVIALGVVAMVSLAGAVISKKH